MSESDFANRDVARWYARANRRERRAYHRLRELTSAGREAPGARRTYAWAIDELMRAEPGIRFLGRAELEAIAGIVSIERRSLGSRRVARDPSGRFQAVYNTARRREIRRTVGVAAASEIFTYVSRASDQPTGHREAIYRVRFTDPTSGQPRDLRISAPIRMDPGEHSLAELERIRRHQIARAVSEILAGEWETPDLGEPTSEAQQIYEAVLAGRLDAIIQFDVILGD